MLLIGRRIGESVLVEGGISIRLTAIRCTADLSGTACDVMLEIETPDGLRVMSFRRGSAFNLGVGVGMLVVVSARFTEDFEGRRSEVDLGFDCPGIEITRKELVDRAARRRPPGSGGQQRSVMGRDALPDAEPAATAVPLPPLGSRVRADSPRWEESVDDCS